MRFDEIAKHYSLNSRAILSAKKNEWAIDPYAWNDVVDMTPIEDRMWSTIRSFGGVMYPQFPAIGFFLDFANPVAKVCIECDGAQFHDAKKDAVRDAKLSANGWRVYRFNGSDCHWMGRMDRNEHDALVHIRNESRVRVHGILCSHGLIGVQT